MARARPSAPSSQSRKGSTSWRRRRSPQRRSSTIRLEGVSIASGRLDIFAQRFLLVLVFLHAPFDDIADRNQADDPLAIEDRQVAEFSERHHLHDRADGIGLLAAHDLARHHRTDRLFEDGSAALAEHAHDVALRQDALDAARTHDEHGADLALAQDFDRGRKFLFRRNALDLVSFGIENGTYRHCRLPEANRALERAPSWFTL